MYSVPEVAFVGIHRLTKKIQNLELKTNPDIKKIPRFLNYKLKISESRGSREYFENPEKP